MRECMSMRMCMHTHERMYSLCVCGCFWQLDEFVLLFVNMYSRSKSLLDLLYIIVFRSLAKSISSSVQNYDNFYVRIVIFHIF